MSKDAKGHGSNGKGDGVKLTTQADQARLQAGKPSDPPKGWMTLKEAAGHAREGAMKLKDPSVESVHVLHHPKVHINAHSVAHSDIVGRRMRDDGAKSLAAFTRDKSGKVKVK